MNIPINKDIEAYRDDFMQGFTMRETLFVAVGAGIIIGVDVLVWQLTGLSPDLCVYVGIPFGMPFILIGFIKVQGLTFFNYIKEIMYVKKTKMLLYDAEEMDPEEPVRIFTMKSRYKPVRKKRRRKKYAKKDL